MLVDGFSTIVVFFFPAFLRVGFLLFLPPPFSHHFNVYVFVSLSLLDLPPPIPLIVRLIVDSDLPPPLSTHPSFYIPVSTQALY